MVVVDKMGRWSHPGVTQIGDTTECMEEVGQVSVQGAVFEQREQQLERPWDHNHYGWDEVSHPLPLPVALEYTSNIPQACLSHCTSMVVT